MGFTDGEPTLVHNDGYWNFQLSIPLIRFSSSDFTETAGKTKEFWYTPYRIAGVTSYG